MRKLPEKFKPVFSKCLILGFSLLLGLLLSEAILRITPSLRQKYSLKMFTTKFSPLQWLDNPGVSYKFKHSKLLGHQRVPNCAPDINSYGLIGDEFKRKKPPHIFRVLVLGDSIAAQNYFVDFLRKKLNRLPEAKKFQVINAGVGSYQLWHYLRFLQYKGVKLNPDMVLISLSLDDARLDKYTCYKTGEGVEIYSIFASRLFDYGFFNLSLFRKSYLYRVFVVALENILSAKEYDPKEKAVANLSKMKKISQKIKAPLFAFIWPALIRYQDYSQWEKKQYHLLTNSLKEADIDYLDLSEVLPQGRRGELRERKLDYVHPSPEAHYMATQAIFNYIIKHYRKYLE
jgi:hypothetical protein